MLMRETLVGAPDRNPPGFAPSTGAPTDQDLLGTVSAMQRPLAFLAALAVLAGCTPDAAPTAPAASRSQPPAAAAVDYAAWRAGESEPVADKLYPQRGNA